MELESSSNLFWIAEYFVFQEKVSYNFWFSFTRKLLILTLRLSTKTKNLRTMFSTGRRAHITREMNENKLLIFDISEYKWTGFGSPRTQTCQTVLFSGQSDNHQQGVTLILKKDVEKSLLRGNQ